VQGLRSCRNAGIPVPKEIIDKAVEYIKNCTLPEGGVQYSSKGGGGRPAITAAAIACLFNAGEYDNEYVPRMLKYCEQNLGSDSRSSYAQVQYREGGERWEAYRNEIDAKLLREADEVKIGDKAGVQWTQGYIGPVYTTALNLIILQLDNAALPIYQR
jgi:hypothetical protein